MLDCHVDPRLQEKRGLYNINLVLNISPFSLHTVSLDNILSDVRQIKLGMELTQREFETHKHPILKDFIAQSRDKVNKVGDL